MKIPGTVRGENDEALAPPTIKIVMRKGDILSSVARGIASGAMRATLAIFPRPSAVRNATKAKRIAGTR